MAAYIVSTVSISDPDRFKNYLAGIDGLAQRHGGSYLLRGAVTEMLEGPAAESERVVVLAFPDVAAARAFYRSDQYQTAKRHREGAATVTMRLIET